MSDEEQEEAVQVAPKKLPPGVSFTINEDGSVTFDGLGPELMDLAFALDPDATVACDLPEQEDD